jgi:hypothetical protein
VVLSVVATLESDTEKGEEYFGCGKTWKLYTRQVETILNE